MSCARTAAHTCCCCASAVTAVCLCHSQPFESPEAQKLNKEIFETMVSRRAQHSQARTCWLELLAGRLTDRLVFSPFFSFLQYFAALTASKDLAIRDGVYASYEGSPASKGILQFDMWNVKPDSGRWDWDALKAEIKQHGLRNSLLLAPMPTASTSQILGNNEVSRHARNTSDITMHVRNRSHPCAPTCNRLRSFPR